MRILSNKKYTSRFTAWSLSFLNISLHVCLYTFPFFVTFSSPPFSICYRFNERYNKESLQVNNSCVVIPIQYLFFCSYKVYFQRITLFSLNNQKNYRPEDYLLCTILKKIYSTIPARICTLIESPSLL